MFETLELRQSTKTVKKSLVCDMDTDNHLIKRVARYPSPVLVCPLQHLRQVGLKAEASRIQTIPAIIPLFQCQEVIMHVAQVIKHIPQAHIFRMFAYLILVDATRAFLFSLSLFRHWISRITSLSPTKWEETSTLPSGNASYACQRDTSIKPQFTENVKCFSKKTLWSHTRGRTSSPT